MDDSKERIAAFLRYYVETPGGGLLPAQDVYLKAGIAEIIENGVMTKDEIRKEALKKQHVIIPESYFTA